jgi:hypothetical protein
LLAELDRIAVVQAADPAEQLAELFAAAERAAALRSRSRRAG